jgi:hypothetical protein
VRVVLDSVPAPIERDWLAALQHAGTRVTWSSAHIAPTAITTTREVDPAGVSEISAWAPRGSSMLLRDPVGVMDSVTASGDGTRLDVPGSRARAGVSVHGTTAWAPPPDSVVFKRLLIEGAASWETKFTIAALTERGWMVDAITHVAPGVDVRQGEPMLPDTSRYAAIIAVDSTASLVARGAGSFVRSGGGLVTLHDASGIGPHADVFTVLDRRANGDVRASRVGSGRVIRVGYADLWRERMTDRGTIPDPVAEHRAFMARTVAAVAYAPRLEAGPDAFADPAPLADLVDRIGPQTRVTDDLSPLRGDVPSSVLFGLLLASLLAELGSRRLRGAR